jgi:hypothetical protein
MQKMTMNIKYFYEKSQEEIVELFRDFIVSDMFERYPKLKDKISLIITGSVPSNHYDQYSDIDCEFFYVEESDREAMNAIVKEYKKSIHERKLPIQFHPAKTFEELRQEHLNGWENDDALREYSIALVVLDPEDRYKKIASTIQWYPEDVLNEKINWLFAESIFHFEDRFVTAAKRGNALYAYSVRLHIIKLLGNALLMTGGHWPVFEKHLSTELNAYGENGFCLAVSDLLVTTDLGEMQMKLKKIIALVEDRLLRDGRIEKRTSEQWILLRPKYQVEHCR